MSYVVIYRRGKENIGPLTILKNASIRQIGTVTELGLGLGATIFIQIERYGYGYDYYTASAYRVMEVSRDAETETRS